MSRKIYKRYDFRLKNLVATSEDISQFYKLGIPKSTLRQWQQSGPVDFVTIPELNIEQAELVKENLSLKSKLESIEAEYQLVKNTITIFGFQIQYRRLPSSDSKTEIIAAIKSATELVSLQTCLPAIGLSAARYSHWLKRQVQCLLKDQPRCPRVSPTQMLRSEICKIKDIFTSKSFAHYSIQSLCWLGKRTSEVVASPTTWYRVIKQLGLKRSTVRIYPTKPKVGVRASAPCQIWHLDFTIIKLQDGTKAFVQCVIDNFSRYVLAWKVSPDFGGLNTKNLLESAILKAKSFGFEIVPNVFVDSGSENLNQYVDTLIFSNQITRTIAQIDVDQANSMVEMLFHRLKHRHLFRVQLTNHDVLVKEVDFYITEENSLIPHSVLNGATPEEVMLGKWNLEKINSIKEKILEAKASRLLKNTELRCLPCIA